MSKGKRGSKAVASSDILGDLNGNEQSGSEKKSAQKQSNGVSPAAWYKTGTDAAQQSQTLNATQMMRKERFVPNFHLKEGEQKTFVVVDDTGFGIYQHDIQVGGKWMSLTCMKEVAPCPICARGNAPKWVVYYTGIDVSPYTDKKGVTTKFRKALLCAKGTTAQLRITDEKEKCKGLVGNVLIMKRYGAKDAGCGTIIDNKGRVNITQKFGAEFAKPFDYFKVLALPSKEELEAIGFGGSVIAGGVDDLSNI